MRRILPGLVLAIALASPRPVLGQTKGDVARADALFNAAKALTDAGQFADACAKFAESKRLAPGLGVTLYLADCYEHIGHTASAWTEFRSAEGQARERNDKRAEVARARAQALEPKLTRITITVAPTVPRTGLSILRDGLPVESEELGIAVPVDPGDHVVVVSSPNHPTRTLSAHVGPEKPAVTVPIDTLDDGTSPALPATVAANAAAGSTPPPVSAGTPLVDTPDGGPPPRDGGGTTRRWLGLGVGGLGVVGVGLGTALGLMAKSKLDQSNGGPCDATNHCDASGLSMRKDAESAANLSTILFVAGGVALATGVVLYVTAPRRRADTGIVVAPAPLVGGGAAVVRASF
jgi:serine/threonine-protein kinase